MNKMVINHLDKLFVTNDAATIVNELEVQHPAAKLLVLAGRAQQEEIGDGANFVVSFAGELLEKAEELIRMGLHPSEIIMGYNKAINKVSSHFQSDRSGIVKTCSLNVGSFPLYSYAGY
jgi:T-complex protein 1 subunit theta